MGRNFVPERSSGSVEPIQREKEQRKDETFQDRRALPGGCVRAQRGHGCPARRRRVQYKTCIKAAKVGKVHGQLQRQDLLDREQSRRHGQVRTCRMEQRQKSHVQGQEHGDAEKRHREPAARSESVHRRTTVENVEKAKDWRSTSRTPKKNASGSPTEPGKIEGSTECTKEKPEGSVTGPKTTTWKTPYKKCKGNGVPCNTKGKGNEEIKPTSSNRRWRSSTNADKRARHQGQGPRPGRSSGSVRMPDAENQHRSVRRSPRPGEWQRRTRLPRLRKSSSKAARWPCRATSTKKKHSPKVRVKASTHGASCSKRASKHSSKKAKRLPEAEGACFGTLGAGRRPPNADLADQRRAPARSKRESAR